MKILVLDDDRELWPFYASVLKLIPSVGRVDFASNEGEFEWEMKAHPHLVIADIHMAPTEGPEILRKHQEQLKGVEVVIFSCADRIKEETVKLEEDGLNVRGYLQKPLKPAHLFEMFGYDFS